MYKFETFRWFINYCHTIAKGDHRTSKIITNKKYNNDIICESTIKLKKKNDILVIQDIIWPISHTRNGWAAKSYVTPNIGHQELIKKSDEICSLTWRPDQRSGSPYIIYEDRACGVSGSEPERRYDIFAEQGI